MAYKRGEHVKYKEKDMSEYAPIWREVLPLGLTKKGIMNYLNVHGRLSTRLWKYPSTVLTVKHLYLLAGLLAPRYSVVDIAKLLDKHTHPTNSDLFPRYMELMGILMTDEGRVEWRAFLARKVGNKKKASIRAYKKLKASSGAAFREVSPVLEGTIPIEISSEFLIERERKQSNISTDNSSSSSTDSPVINL